MKKWEKPQLSELGLESTKDSCKNRGFLGSYTCVKCGKVYEQWEANAIKGECTTILSSGEVCKGDLKPVCSCS